MLLGNAVKIRIIMQVYRSPLPVYVHVMVFLVLTEDHAIVSLKHISESWREHVPVLPVPSHEAREVLDRLALRSLRLLNQSPKLVPSQPRYML